MSWQLYYYCPLWLQSMICAVFCLQVYSSGRGLMYTSYVRRLAIVLIDTLASQCWRGKGHAWKILLSVVVCSLLHTRESIFGSEEVDLPDVTSFCLATLWIVLVCSRNSHRFSYAFQRWVNISKWSTRGCDRHHGPLYLDRDFDTILPRLLIYFANLVF